MGRMGRAILAILAENPYGLTLSAAVEAAGAPLWGRTRPPSRAGGGPA
jgi:dihydrodipicolinate reductase